MSAPFEIGDVVRLNCSSTRMTVDEIDAENDDGAIQCIWFDVDGELKSARFHAPQLVLVKKSTEF